MLWYSYGGAFFVIFLWESSVVILLWRSSFMIFIWRRNDVIFLWRSSAIIFLCIMAYIISFDVWCAIFELTPDTSILPRRWSFRFPFCYMELLIGQCSKSSAIFKYRTVHTVYSDKDKRSCQMNNFSDTFC